jgi:deoxyadenosine/deoxycytidine kinase
MRDNAATFATRHRATRSIPSDVGATSVLVYLEASHDELWSRVSKRNTRHEADLNSIYFSESD